MFDAVYNAVFRQVFSVIMKVMPPPAPKLYQGQGSAKALCQHISDTDVNSLLIITSAELVELGLLKPYVDLLEQLEVSVSVFDKIEPNPSIDSVKAAIECYHQHQCQGVLAFGGGSVIDASKAVTLQIGNNVPVEKLVGLFKASKKAVPFFAIPTTAGTGSEITSAAVISGKDHQKMFIVEHKCIPIATALDSEPMLGLPNFITADTGIDVLTHAVEAYISKVNNPKKIPLAINAVKLVFENLPKAYHQGSDHDARANMALASFQAGDAFNYMGLGFVHAISHQLTAFYQVPHGRANAIVLPYVLTASFNAIAPSLAKLSIDAGLANGETDQRAIAQQFIEQIKNLLAEVNIPSTIEKIKTEDIPAIVKGARKEAVGNYAVPYLLSVRQCTDILKQLQGNK